MKPQLLDSLKPQGKRLTSMAAVVIVILALVCGITKRRGGLHQEVGLLGTNGLLTWTTSATLGGVVPPLRSSATGSRLSEPFQLSVTLPAFRFRATWPEVTRDELNLNT